MKKGIVGFIVLILLFGAGYAINESKKEYIGGNVLHLTFFTEVAKGNTSIAPAWINNGQVYHFLFDPLVLANHDSTSFTPRIAQSYEVQEDSLVYKFVIRDNLKWSDGENLTIDDVMFSLELAKSLPSIGQLYDNAFAKMTKFEAQNNTLIITLNEAHSGFLVALSQFLIFPKHILSKEGQNMPIAEFWENPIGSGMYTLDKKTDDYYSLILNPYYTGKKPKIETILLHKDPHAKKDCYFTTNIPEMRELRNMRGYIEHPVPIPFYRYFVFNIAGDDGHTNPPMQDINVRNALAKAIDNDAILQILYSNMAYPYKVSDPHNYDVIGAKELLTKSNYDLSRPLRIGYYYKDDTSIYFVKTVAKYFQDIGFKIEYVVEDSLEDFYAKRHFDILFKDEVVVHPTDWYLEHHSTHDSASIFGHKGKYDTRILHIIQTQDATRQQELMTNLNAPLIDELYRYPVLSLNQAVYINEERLKIPSYTKLGNPNQVLDINIEDWEIKKK